MSESGNPRAEEQAGVAAQDAAEEEAAGLALAEAAGIHRLAIPTPFQVGRINAYLIEDSPLTLIDSGPNSATALDELEQALARRGHAVEDIELLVVTHQHIDHFGLASILARRSNAEVAALDRLAPYLSDYRREAELDDRFALAMMLRHGIPADVASALRSLSSNFRAWGAPVEIHRPLTHGSELELAGRKLRVLHRPGHSPSDTLFFDEQRSILLAGDHLLKHISSNPLIARPLPLADSARPGEAIDDSRPTDEAPDGAPVDLHERPPSLINYIDSLNATREMELSLVLPGHGPTISDHTNLIDERMRLHERRARKIKGILAEGPRTGYQIAQELWGNIAVTQAYLTLSEVVGHLDLLLRDGLIEELDVDGVASFSAL